MHDLGSKSVMVNVRLGYKTHDTTLAGSPLGNLRASRRSKGGEDIAQITSNFVLDDSYQSSEWMG